VVCKQVEVVCRARINRVIYSHTWKPPRVGLPGRPAYWTKWCARSPHSRRAYRANGACASLATPWPKMTSKGKQTAWPPLEIRTYIRPSRALKPPAQTLPHLTKAGSCQANAISRSTSLHCHFVVALNTHSRSSPTRASRRHRLPILRSVVPGIQRYPILLYSPRGVLLPCTPSTYRVDGGIWLIYPCTLTRHWTEPRVG